MQSALIAIALVGGFIAACMLARALTAAYASNLSLERDDRRREHWRTIAEAAFAVQRAADRYSESPPASEELRRSVDIYKGACARLRLALASGPSPTRVQPLLILLCDAKHPEAVHATRAGDEVLDELALLQNALEARELAGAAASGRHRMLAHWRLRLLALRQAFRA